MAGQRTTGRPAGRPTRVDELFDIGPDGNPRTISDAICYHLANGCYLETACDLVGIHPQVVRQWLHDGAKARQRRQRGAKTRDLTAYQRRAARFSEAAHEAYSAWEARDLGIIDKLAAGGTTITEVAEQWERVERQNPDDPDGEPIVEMLLTGRKITTKQLPPDLKAITFRLTRKRPQQWGVATESVALPQATDAERAPASQALEEARRKVERTREVRAELPAVIDVPVRGENTPEQG